MEVAVDKILAHADLTLDAASLGEGREERLGAFKRFLKLETERLRIRHRFGLGGREIALGRSHVVDQVVTRACQLAAAEFAPTLSGDQEHIAVVALGGYGRRELAPFSDVDLLFLRADRADEDIKALVERALALLWDAGLTVGHSFRTVGQCAAMGKDDLHTRTALSEARLVTGSEALFTRLRQQLDSLVFGRGRTTEAFLESLRFDLAERYVRFGPAVGLQEPHVKESPGGLRDLHAVTWVAHARFGTGGLAALSEQGRISERERKAALRSYDHLCRIRNEAHFITGRKTDLLTLDLQPVLAHNLGYRPRRGLLASEIFMRDYYERACELHHFCRTFLLRHAPAVPKRRFALGLLRRRPRGTFEIRDGKLFSRGDAAPGSARGLVDAFAIAQSEGLELSEELKLHIREGLHLVDRTFRESGDWGRAFLRLLAREGGVGRTLRAMHETGLLGRLLPEFARVTFLVQHDFYHRYTVDEHTLTAIDALDRIAESGDAALARFRKVLDEVEQPAALYLGLFLHDIGKGRGGGHVRRGVRIADRVLSRLKVEGKTAADATFLVDAHLEMSQISQRRDLTEPGLTEAFASRVATVDRLNMLLLLTYADHCGVGPGIWNEWKGSLLWDLYTRTRAHLVQAHPRAAEGRLSAREKASRQLQAEFPGSEVERHFALMPEKYLRATDGGDMVRHFRLLQSLGDHPLVAEWESEEHCTDLVIATRDHPGLFAQLAGTLTAHALDILSVDLYTREDGLVIDVFKVRELGHHGPVEASRWPLVEKALRTAAQGGYDVAAAVEKRRKAWPRRSKRRPAAAPVVRFDSLSSAGSSVIEVRADDEPGLAFRIASALSSYGLNITFAKIATEKSHALDVFYVTDARGGKLDPEETTRVEAALLAVLDPRRKDALMKEGG